MARFCHWPSKFGLISISWQICAEVRRSVQIDRTAVIFCCGSNILRVRLSSFIFYILSNIVDKFFFRWLILAVHEHFDFTLFSPDHHRLTAHAAYHVKRVHRPAPEGQFEGIFLHALFKRVFQIVLDLEKPVGRAQASDTLMWSFVVIVFDPKSCSRNGLFEAVELGPEKKLVLDAFPESLDFSQCHGMVGTRFDMLDTIFFHFSFKPRLAPPVGVLAAVVGEHLTWHAILGNTPAVSFQNMLCRLASVKTQAGDVARIIVHKADQIGVSSGQPEGHDVALPQLVWGGSLKKAGFCRILLRLFFRFCYQTLFGKSFSDGGGAGSD
jgi:hypothetical protein